MKLLNKNKVCQNSMKKITKMNAGHKQFFVKNVRLLKEKIVSNLGRI